MLRYPPPVLIKLEQQNDHTLCCHPIEHIPTRLPQPIAIGAWKSQSLFG
jgi:hypothetical protein